MSGLGYGIGSFLDGLADGVRAGQEMGIQNRRMQIYEEELARKTENDAFERDYKTKLMKRQEERDKIDAENSAFDRSYKQHLLTNQDAENRRAEERLGFERKRLEDEQKDREANAPLVEATRKERLLEEQKKIAGSQADVDVLKIGQDAKSEYERKKAKSILVGKDEAGQPVYTVDGEKVATKEDADKIFEQRNGSFVDSFYNDRAPKIIETYIANGQLEKAEQFRKFLAAEQGRKTVEVGGRLIQSYLMGDMDGVNKYMNQIADKFLVRDGMTIKAEPLKDKDGNTVGVRGVFTEKATGKTFHRDFAGNQLTEMVSGLSDPTVLFEQGIQETKRLREQAAEERKKGIDTGADIMKQGEKSDDEIRAQIIQDIKDPNKNVNANKMSPEDFQKEFNIRYSLWKSRGKSILPPTTQSGGVKPNLLMPQTVR